jgi:hypothetical protein
LAIGIVDKIQTSAFSQNETPALFPIWHFDERKAVEMWAKEVYRHDEMFPLSDDLKFGPLTGIKGPRTPVLLLKRAFGLDCFEVYFQSASHKQVKKSEKGGGGGDGETKGGVKGGAAPAPLPPLLQAGGAWEGGKKVPLRDEHYLPMQPFARAERRPTLHGREQLFAYLEEQERREKAWLGTEADNHTDAGSGGGGTSAVSTANSTSSTASATSTASSATSTASSATGSTSSATSTTSSATSTTGTSLTKVNVVYMDGVFDLFHVGHLEAIQQVCSSDPTGM